MTAARHPFAGFVFLFIGSTAAAIDYSAPSVIFDAVMADLGMSAQAATFIQTLFLGCLGASLIVMGSLGDEVGKKRLCLIGLAIMMAANVIAAAAPSGPVLLLARAVQGVGMAAFLSTMVALCSALFDDPKQKALAFSLFGASVGLAVTTSTLIGEEALERFGWRSLFILVVPLLAIAWAGIARLVHEKTSYAGEIQFDPLGAVLIAVSLLALIFGLSEGPTYGWLSSPLIAGMFATAVIAFVIFNVHQLRRLRNGRYVAFDYALFRIPSFASGTLTTFLYFAGALAVQQIWPSLLHTYVAGLTRVDIGLLMAGVGVSFTVTSLAASRIAQVIGAKNTVIAGIGTNLVCLGLMIALFAAEARVSIPLLATVLFAFGAGYGLVFTKLTFLAVAGIDAAHASSASGVLLSARQTSAAIGAAGLVAILQAWPSLLVVNAAAAALVTASFAASFFLREPPGPAEPKLV